MFALFFLRYGNEETNAEGMEQNEATESENELASEKLTPATEPYGRREVRACDEVAFEACQLVPETYNRSRVRSVCNGDAQGSFRFSGAAV
jgi:hypothetical protein